MKKIKYLILVFTLLLLMPFGVSAKDKVNVYLFRGDGCPHCAEAEEFFSKIEKEYGKYYNLIGYEVWYNKDNATLMEEVAKKLGTEASGVPFIVIGEKYYSGFAESMEEEIKTVIKEVYDSENKTDVINDMPKSVLSKTTADNVPKKGNSNDAVALFIILVIITLLVLLIINARNKVNERTARIDNKKK